MFTKYQCIGIKNNEILLKKPDNQTRKVLTHEEGLAFTNKKDRQLNNIGQKKYLLSWKRAYFGLDNQKIVIRYVLYVKYA